MTTATDAVGGSASTVLDQYRPKVETKSRELGKDAFLELMIAQLEHQDPLSPQENGEFITQLAQFSQVQGLGDLNSAVSGMATAMRSSLALQASSLVGRQVRVPSSTGSFDGSTPMDGVAVLPGAASRVRVQVLDGAGTPVRTYDYGPKPAGQLPVTWDGRDDAGRVLPAGRYAVRAEGDLGDGAEALAVELNANVNSVSIDSDGAVVLNVAGVGPVAMSDVREVR